MTASELRRIERAKTLAELHAWAADLRKRIRESRRRRNVKVTPSRQQTRREELKPNGRAVYAEVADRDAGLCTVQLAAVILGECEGALQIDHQWGRGKAPTTVQNCRKLCRKHHQMKTDGNPSRLMWLNDFYQHAVSHDYHAEAAKAEAQIALERAQWRVA